MARILKSKPSPHGAASNPQVGSVDPIIRTHTDRQDDQSCCCRAARGVGEPLQSVCDKEYLKGVYKKQSNRAAKPKNIIKK
jgi:hypothetical protein